MPDEDALDWVEDYDALCVTLVRGMNPADALASLLQGDGRPFGTRAEAEDWVAASEDYDRNWLAAGEVDGWTFIWEENGWRGADPDTAANFSRQCLAVSGFWKLNAVMSFVVGGGGEVRRPFDPLFHDDSPAPTTEVGERLPDEAGFDWQESAAE